MITTYEAQIIQKKKLTTNVYLLKCRLPNLEDWNYLAGQYMIFHIPTPDGKVVRRLYSIASSPRNTESIDFIIELIEGGVGSEYIDKINEGDKIKLQGPAGIFVFKPTNHNVVFLATGTGFAPIYSMIKSNIGQFTRSVQLFWGMRTITESYYLDELNLLKSRMPHFSYKLCLSREVEEFNENCITGHVDCALESVLQNNSSMFSDTDFYICGGKGVVESLRDYLHKKNIPNDQIFFEKFT